MTDQRRLAAILVADVVGYSRLVGQDEAGTLAHLAALRREVIEPIIARHAGRLFKAVGDGFLVEFASAVQAVSCAKAIQEANVGGGLPLRIGIHVGDVVVQGDDLMGDGVNIAARIEGVAEAGGIAISRAVHEQVRDKLDVSFVDKGEVALKNLARPVQVFAVGGAVPSSAVGSAPALVLPDKPSIAVLPFQNMSGDPEQEYFVDGLVEDIITGLSRFRSLFVIARNSSFAYKGKSPDIRQVGRELGVRYVLEGSVRKAGGRVRITGQLIEAASGAHLWADRFDGALEDVFDLQDHVTTSIVGAITPKVEQVEIERTRRKPTENLDAYDLHLRAVGSARLSTRTGIDEAMLFCKRAIALDPSFALAHGQAAMCYAIRKMYRWATPKDSDIAETDRLARQAWALDPDDAVAIGLAGYALAYVAKDLEAGATYIERALAQNPNYAPNWLYSGLLHTWLASNEIAIDHLTRAMRLSPRDPEVAMIHMAIGNAHYFLHHYDDATQWARRSLHERPDFHPALRIGAAAAAMAGRETEASKLCERLQQVYPDLRLSTLGATLGPYRDPEHLTRFAEGLRLAGLPE